MKEATIHVAVGRIRLDLPGCRSLKQKRGVIRPIVRRIRDRFGISAAEVGLQDVWQSAVVAVAAVGEDPGVVTGLVGEVVRFLRGSRDAKVVEFGVEAVPVSRIEPSDPEALPATLDIEAAWIGAEEGGEPGCEEQSGDEPAAGDDGEGDGR